MTKFLFITLITSALLTGCGKMSNNKDDHDTTNNHPYIRYIGDDFTS